MPNEHIEISTQLNKNLQWLSPLAACMLGFTIRLYQLGHDSLWYDETVSAYLAGQPTGQLIAHTALDIHPPGYYLSLRAWLLLAGKSEFSLAFFSLFFGVLLIALIYCLGLRLFDRRCANAAAWLCALSAYGVWYSQEVRMYTLAACCTVLLILVTSKVISQPTPYRTILWGTLVAAFLYILYYALFVIFFASLVWLIYAFKNAKKKQTLLSWVIGHITVIVFYVPWLPTAIRQAIEPPVPPWRSSIPLHQIIDEGARALFAGHALPEYLLPIAVIFIAIAAVAPFLVARQKSSAILSVGGFMVPWGMITAISLLVTPLFHPRYLFIYVPLFWLSLGSIASLRPNVKRKAFIYACITVFICLNIWSQYRTWTKPEYHADDLRGLVERFLQEWCPGDAILINAGYVYTAFDYYWPAEVSWQGRATDYHGQIADKGPVVILSGTIDGVDNLGWSNPQADFYTISLPQLTSAIQDVVKNNRRLWQFRLYDTTTDATGQFRNWLSENYLLTEDQLIAGSSYPRLQAFVPVLQQYSCPQPVIWGGKLTSCAAVGTATTDRLVPVYLELSPAQGTRLESLHYTLRLVNNNGEIKAQKDGLLGGTALGDNQDAVTAIVPQSLPISLPKQASPGQYKVQIGVYTFSDGQIENLIPAINNDGNPLLNIGEICIDCQ